MFEPVKYDATNGQWRCRLDEHTVLVSQSLTALAQALDEVENRMRLDGTWTSTRSSSTAVVTRVA
jgi:hypothetical protein